MDRRRILGAGLVACALVTVTPAKAETRGESLIQGSARVSQTCLLTSQSFIRQKDTLNPPQESVGAVAAAFAGQVVSGGLTALGGVLEEAARAHAFNATGGASYGFYSFGEIDPAEAGLATPRPRQTLCLSFAVPEAAGRGRVPQGELASITLTGPDNASVSSTGLAALGLPDRPALYVEALLEQRADGFVVRPVLVWYRSPIAGAPNRALPAEIQVTFSIPSSGGTEAASSATFAVARMPLGPLQPRETAYGFDELRLTTSPVLPVRPRTGTTETLATALVAVETELSANAAELRALGRQVPRARALAEARDAKPETIAAYNSLMDREAEAQRLTPLLTARRLSLRTQASTAILGSTNVQVRVALVRDQNRFLAAIATALKGQAPAAGTAVTNALTPQTNADAWNASDTAYVQAMNTVDQRQAEFDLALATGDAAGIRTANAGLRNAKAAANQAAALSDRAIPFPGLI